MHVLYLYNVHAGHTNSFLEDRDLPPNLGQAKVVSIFESSNESRAMEVEGLLFGSE